MFTAYQVPFESYYNQKTQSFIGFCPRRELSVDYDRPEDIKKIVDNFKSFVPVANFEVDDLEGVFIASNSPYDRDYYESVTYRLEPMQSVSCGDLIKDPSGDFYVVTSNGFCKIEEISQ